MTACYFLAVFALLAVFYQAPVLAQNGLPCHSNVFTITPRHALNLTAFLGLWYPHEYASSHIGNTPAPDYRCLSINLTRPNSNQSLALQAEERYIDLETDLVQTGVASIAVNDSRSPLSSIWTLTNGNQTVDMILLATDLEFSNWSVFYQCQIIGPQNYRWETVTAYTRDRNIGNELRQFLKALMVGIGFRIGDHHPINQNNCVF